MNSIYLDNAATTDIHPSVALAIFECLKAHHVNPASQHAAGRRSRAVLDDAREEIVEMLGGSHNSQLILTSGGTEANNTAILGLAGTPPAKIVVSQIEHPSVLAATQLLHARGHQVVSIPTLPSGVVDLDAALQLIDPNTQLVSVMFGNHETGVLQPVQQIADHCYDLGVSMHVDAVQAIGKLPISFDALRIAAMTVTPHKFHGPRNIGGLLLAEHCHLSPMLVGGSQQLGLRSGTEDVALSVGFCSALRIACDSISTHFEHLSSIRAAFERKLTSLVPQAVVVGAHERRLPHISNVAFPDLSRQALLMNLDLLGVACSTGSACTSGSSEPSPVLKAMRLDDDLIDGALRFSFSPSTTARDCEVAVDHILKSINNLRAE